MYVCMYVCMYVYFGQFKMAALEVYALQGSQSFMVAFRLLFIKRNSDIDMCLHGNTSKKPLLCDIAPTSMKTERWAF